VGAGGCEIVKGVAPMPAVERVVKRELVVLDLPRRVLHHQLYKRVIASGKRCRGNSWHVRHRHWTHAHIGTGHTHTNDHDTPTRVSRGESDRDDAKTVIARALSAGEDVSTAVAGVLVEFTLVYALEVL
jgi:hypothetical protein